MLHFKEVVLMPASSDRADNIPDALVLRWVLKAFLVGLFVGAGAALNALINR